MRQNVSLKTVFLLSAVASAGLLLAVASVVAEADQLQLSKENMKKMRKQAANRQRRIVYNDDGCHGVPGKTREDWLACRVKHVTNTQVDTICYCTGGGGVFWSHQPKVGEVLGDWVEEGHGAYVKQMRDILIALKKQGTDPLAVVIDHSHKNNMEVFWSYRMNNPECSFATWALSGLADVWA